MCASGDGCCTSLRYFNTEVCRLHARKLLEIALPALLCMLSAIFVLWARVVIWTAVAAVMRIVHGPQRKVGCMEAAYQAGASLRALEALS